MADYLIELRRKLAAERAKLDVMTDQHDAYSQLQYVRQLEEQLDQLTDYYMLHAVD